MLSYQVKMLHFG